VVALGAAAGAARGEGAAAPANAYPLTLRVELSPRSRAVTYDNLTPGGVSGPPTPAGSVAVGDLVARAWAEMARRAFAGRAPEPDLRVEVEIAGADADLTRGGWSARLEQRLTVRDAAGAELARWSIRREAPIVGLGEGAVPRAFARAAAEATDGFERELPELPGAAAFLATRGVAPRQPPEPPPPPPAPADPPRARVAAFVDAGALTYLAEDQPAWSTQAPVVVGFAARAGVSGGPVFAALSFQSSQEQIHPAVSVTQPDAESFVASRILGLDLGAAWRPRGRHELDLGIGLGRLSATAHVLGVELPSTSFLPSVFASYVYAAPWGAKRRVRAAVEVRKPLGSAPSFEELDSPGWPPVTAPVTNVSFRLLVGLELGSGAR
jgi:hypothetical protein